MCFFSLKPGKENQYVHTNYRSFDWLHVKKVTLSEEHKIKNDHVSTNLQTARVGNRLENELKHLAAKEFLSEDERE